MFFLNTTVAAKNLKASSSIFCLLLLYNFIGIVCTQSATLNYFCIQYIHTYIHTCIAFLLWIPVFYIFHCSKIFCLFLALFNIYMIYSGNHHVPMFHRIASMCVAHASYSPWPISACSKWAPGLQEPKDFTSRPAVATFWLCNHGNSFSYFSLFPVCGNGKYFTSYGDTMCFRKFGSHIEVCMKSAHSVLQNTVKILVK